MYINVTPIMGGGGHFRLWPFHVSDQNIYFPLQLWLTQTHHSTHKKLLIFEMSILDDRLLLMLYSIDTNKEDYDGEMNKLREKTASILDNLVEIVEHMFHHNLISSP